MKNRKNKRQAKEPNLQSKEAAQIMQNLIIKPARVESADVGTWRNAINAAKQGNRAPLYNLYENLLTDPVLADAVDKLTEAVTNAEITFQVAGESVEEIDDLIDTPAFERLIKEMALKFVWGKSVLAVEFSPEFDIFSFPRKNIRITGLDKPIAERRKFIAVKENDRSGYDYTEDDHIIECGEDDDLGLLLRAALFVIYKRGGWGDWAQFVELFVMPFIVGEYDGYNTDMRDKLFDAFRNIGSNPYAAVPKGVNIKIHEGNKGGGDTYDAFTDKCDRQILIAMLGNTMTTLEGSSRAQGEVHMETQEQRFRAIRRYVQRMLNRHLVPLLVKRGYNVAGGFFSFPDAGESISTDKRVDIALKLKGAGIPVDDDYFYEITGIPKAEIDDTPEEKDENSDEAAEDKTEQTKEPKPATKKPAPEKTDKDKADEEKEKQKLADERNFILQLWDKTFGHFFADAPTKWSGAFQNLKRNWTRHTTGKLTLDDGYSIDINKLMQEAVREIYGSKGEELLNKKLFDITNDALQHGIDTSLSRNDVDEDFIREFKENTAVFAAFKNHKQTEEIAKLLYDKDGKLVPFYKFKKRALQISEKYNVQWLRTEYNTAVRAARIAANLKKFEKTKHLYPNLEYMQTSSAEPRDAHLVFVGTVLPIEHESWSWLMPPSDWGCNCWVQQTDKEPTAAPVMPSDINPIFINNPALTAKFLNTEETPYYKHTDVKLREKVADEGKRLLHEYEDGLEVYEGKEGGYLIVTRQDKNEFEDNLKTYKRLADDGKKYKLLRKIEGQKSPDAINLDLAILSDSKVPTTETLVNAFQNHIKKASKQNATEVVFRFENEYSNNEIVNALKRAIQPNRNKNVERIVLLRKDSKPVYLNIDDLLKRFGKTKK